ncbi:IucA/IucC family protein [Macrococcus brunensis]|uniref:IucA/IucC family protein n=1 Tax=Macrococcus brunensis TaxID=198483 RepID=UPI001EF05388|nr:IucA/IucC family protein [Macrococcus brunensis]ULG74504.1 siderophore biosynthesis protein, IucA/IucC family [Macrococcus brunensis]
MWQHKVRQEAARFSAEEINEGITEAIAITNEKLMRAIVREGLLSYTLSAEKWKFHLTGRHVFFYDPGTRSIESGDAIDALQLVHLLECHQTDELNWRTLMPEIENQLINQALSLIFCRHSPAAEHAYLKGEQLCLTGHNLHPCAKIRIEMPFDEVRKYAPEYNDAFQLNWLMVDRNLLFVDLDDKDYRKLIAFSGIEETIPEGWILVPVHPYQFKYVLPDIYSEEIKNGQIKLLPHIGGWVKSTSSFRTVCPLDSRYPVIKLPVDIQITSTKRSISRTTALNAKKVTDYIRTIYLRDAELNHISRPVYELGGVTMRKAAVPKQRNLSFLLRENISDSIDADELYCANCLFEQVGGRVPIAKQLIQSTGSSPIDWFEKYVELLATVTLKMMSLYGIGLEAHLQNISVAFNNGFPVSIYYRDWGGLRIDEVRARQLALEKGLTSATREEMYEKVQNTLISNHLSELVKFFVTLGYSEERLWQIVRKRIDDFYRMHPAVKDYEQLTAAVIYEKALLSMRLMPDRGDIYLEKDNPLNVYAYR